LASWRVDLYREDVENAVYLGQAALLLGLGMSIWLAVVPLHGWLTGAGEAPPLAAALVLTGFPLLGLVTLLQLLREATWFTWHEQVGPLLLLAGLIAAASGGLLAALQRGLRPLLGYAALFDLGCLFIALSLGGTGSAPSFYAGLALRGLALGLTGAASAALGQPAGGDTFAALRGIAYRRPLATAALVIGGFTLAGLPLTAGFLPRWLLFQGLAQSQPGWAWLPGGPQWLLVGGGLGVALGYLRGLHALLALPGRSVPASQSRQPWLASLFLVGLGLLSVWLGLFPDPVFRLVERLLAVYPLPVL
jgi:formate hydrogenlyase subunit 3/multisubunit Na+/H+ antiporter MnhD subunit